MYSSHQYLSISRQYLSIDFNGNVLSSSIPIDWFVNTYRLIVIDTPTLTWALEWAWHISVTNLRCVQADGI